MGGIAGQTHEGLRSYRWGPFGEGTGAETLQNPATGGVSEQIVDRSEASIGFMREPWVVRFNALPPIGFPGSPERWWRDEALQAEAEAAQASGEQRHHAARDIPALRTRSLF